jgi:hypothetical protein
LPRGLKDGTQQEHEPWGTGEKTTENPWKPNRTQEVEGNPWSKKTLRNPWKIQQETRGKYGEPVSPIAVVLRKKRSSCQFPPPILASTLLNNAVACNL